MPARIAKYTVKNIKYAYHTNGVLYVTVGVLITLIKVWLALPSVKYYTTVFKVYNLRVVRIARYSMLCLNSL